ncbi:MAG TPA: hypothetical protein VIM44_02600 [Rariglobus sp.]
MKRPLLFAVLLTGLLAGCATPDKRISRSPEVFARLSPEQQALVKQGKVAVGFEADAVLLAVGSPDRKWTRTDEAGTREVWSYTTWENDRGEALYRGWYHGADGSPFYYLNSPSRREHEYIKVIFGSDGKVAAIEEELPR